MNIFHIKDFICIRLENTDSFELDSIVLLFYFLITTLHSSPFFPFFSQRSRLACCWSGIGYEIFHHFHSYTSAADGWASGPSWWIDEHCPFRPLRKSQPQHPEPGAVPSESDARAEADWGAADSGSGKSQGAPPTNKWQAEDRKALQERFKLLDTKAWSHVLCACNSCLKLDEQAKLVVSMQQQQNHIIKLINIQDKVRAWPRSATTSTLSS